MVPPLDISGAKGMEKSEKVSGSVAPWLAELALVQARQLFESGDETLIGAGVADVCW